MAIPDYETLMLPILQFLSHSDIKKTREIINKIIQAFEITADETKELIPSGRAKLIDNRVGWACTYLRKYGLISSPQRGQNRITDEGLDLLSKNPDRIDSKLLKKLYQEETPGSSLDNDSEIDFTESDITDKTPEEIIGIQSEIIKQSLAKDLLSYISKIEPEEFEQLVVDLLLAMGYGGTVEDAGSAIGRSNDGGIDGLIKEDVLGLDTIYLQAKRWQNTVPIKEIRDFAGALLSKRSNKGVFITTSNFPPSAHEFVSTIDRKIILIDGKRLAQWMIKFNLGVSIKEQISIKEIDIDYFTT
jgi:restriction system protein